MLEIGTKLKSIQYGMTGIPEGYMFVIGTRVIDEYNDIIYYEDGGHGYQLYQDWIDEGGFEVVV